MKRWLWLVSVGVTDLQLPVWHHAKLPEKSQTYRFAPSPHNCAVRELHEVLLQLGKCGRICFPDEMPPAAGRLQESVALQVIDVGGGLWFNYEAGGTGVASPSHTLPNPSGSGGEANSTLSAEQALAIYCPKLLPLIRSGRLPDRRIARPTVIVLQTNRNSEGNATEPIAAGPLVSRFLAQALGIEWQAQSLGRGKLGRFDGISTWLDLLVDHETLEQDEAQRQIRQRLKDAIHAWADGDAEPGNIWITNSGGLPSLKTVVEYTAASAIGERHVRLLTVPERDVKSEAKATEAPRARWIDRDALRLHCLEALRRFDLTTALGLAQRSAQLDPISRWPRMASETLAFWLGWSDCEAPHALPQTIALPHRERLLIRIELALVRRDLHSALLGLHALLELVAVEVMVNSSTLAGYQISFSRDADAFLIPDSLPSSGEKLLGAARTRGLRPDRLILWPAVEALATCHADPMQGCLEWLSELMKGYLIQIDGMSLKALRNQLAHVGCVDVTGEELAARFAKYCGVSHLKQSIGQNILGLNKVNFLLAALRNEPGYRLDVKFNQDIRLLIQTGTRDD